MDDLIIGKRCIQSLDTRSAKLIQKNEVRYFKETIHEWSEGHTQSFVY